jgi:2-succinyl-5-enolpyruvyl-6-hydroxy-3-cyclohexene-1-carboxylate synthase
VARFCAARGWPLLADPLSGARTGAAAVAHYDAILRGQGDNTDLIPDLVLRVGDLPTSKPLRDWLAALEVPQVAIDPDSVWQDPAASLTASLPLDVATTMSQLADQLAPLRAADDQWLAKWLQADVHAGEAIVGVLADSAASEPLVARELGVLLPESATLFVASSMPVRDIESFWPVRDDPPRVLCNRGANGIDGTVSAAFGVCAHQAQRQADGPVVLLIGDVALAHDIGGLIAARRLDLKLTIVLIDNGGGGIFEFLPVSTAEAARGPEDTYTRHIATPTGLDFGNAATLYGLAHELATDAQGFRAALERALAADRSAIVEVRGDRAANLALHRELWDATAAAVAGR